MHIRPRPRAPQALPSEWTAEPGVLRLEERLKKVGRNPQARSFYSGAQSPAMIQVTPTGDAFLRPNGRKHSRTLHQFGQDWREKSSDNRRKGVQAKLLLGMKYSILNNRKRAIIALVHSVAFGLLALYQLIVRYHPVPLLSARAHHRGGAIALTAVYLVVTAMLLVLVAYSRAGLEKLYFAFCATSAGVGLWRVAIGDPTLDFGSFVRVLMLGSAVVVGTMILRVHSVLPAQFAD
jgi:hypothetical protein